MVYIVVIVIFCIGAYLYKGNDNSKGGNFWYALEFIVLVLLATFRSDKMGGDAIYYYDDFDKYFSLKDLNISTLIIGSRFQPLWIIFIACIKSISNNYLFYKFIHAVIVNVSIFSFVNNFPKYRYHFLLLFLLLQFWYFEFEIQREVLAICIFLYSYKYLIRKKYVVYFIFSFLAFLFHISAVILFVLPVFYLGIKKCFSFKYPYFYLVIMGLLLLSFTLSSYAPDLFESSENNLVQGSWYAEKEINSNGITKGIIDFVLTFFLLFYVRRKMNISINYLDIFLLILLFLQILSINMAGIYRFKNYLFLFMLIAAIDTTVQLSRKNKGCKFLMFVFYFYLFVNTIYTYSIFSETSGKPLFFSFYPYISIFD